ncbi:MAG: iron-containing alcohol dehydrogenase, partial [Oscillospiraceae bacterium]|nr:iron-containing alcohol dehydrogenase [Oscillospiraceae bacterium]
EKHRLLYERVKSELPAVRCFISISDSSSDKSIPNLSDIFSLFAGEYPGEPDGDALCSIMFTSGTTGFPKGVMLTHRNFIATGTYVHEAYPTQRMMGVLPFHHAFGLTGNITKTMVNARTLCCNDNLQNVFEDFKLYKPHGMLAVPQMIKFMMNAGFRFAKAHPELSEREAFKEFFGGEFSVISSGSAPLDKELNDRYNATGIGVYNGYGMTECAPIVANNVGGFYKSGSVGRLIPCMKAKIENGEILLKGPNVMKGYYKNPQATKEAFTDDGWLKTGDLGFVDNDGYLFITGRCKNLILLDNGENISAEFLENKLYLDPVIKECVAFGENGALYAEIYPDKDLAAANGITDIRSYIDGVINRVNDSLAEFQKIRGVILRETPFEKTASQKIKRGPVHGAAKKNIVLPSTAVQRIVYEAVQETLGANNISITDNFFTVGGNSLNTAELAALLNISPQTIYDHPVLSELSLQIEAFGKEYEKRFEGINGIIKSSLTDEKSGEYKNILLTGSTGFLGVHILKELVDAGKTVYCLVRDEKRLYSNLKYYFGDFCDPRVIPVIGNIEKNDLGLGDRYLELADMIDTVFHVAANVHHAGDYADLERTNVFGTKNIIDFCFKANAVLQHTSTVSVHGAATVIEQTENAVFTEDILDIGQSYTDNVYIHSKYRAEEEVLLARTRGLKANIYRIGNLTWRTYDGKFQRNSSDNGFLHRIRAILKLGVYHENMDKYPMDLTAVDECARAYVLLALSGGLNRIYHMFNHNFLDVRDMFNLLGMPFRFASTAETIEIMNANLDDTDIHVYMFYMMISGRSSEVKMINQYTAAELKKLGFLWSEPNRAYLTVFSGDSKGQCLGFERTELSPALPGGNITPIGRITLGVLKNAVIKEPEIISGENSVLKIKEALKSRGLKKPLVITVPFEMKTVSELIRSLGEVPVFTDIASEPVVSDTENALNMFLKNGCDCVVGIGGGSVLDTAKITSLRAANPDSFIGDIARLDSECAGGAPLLLAPTTAGTGSESTLFAVVTEEDKNKKRPFTSDKFLPDVIVLDPVLTVSVPKMSTAYTGIDALSHAVESYLSLFAPAFPEDAAFAPKAVKTVFDNLETACHQPDNIDARSGMLNAAFIAGKSFGRIGTGYIHAIAHRLGEFYHVPHGLAISAVFTPVLRAYLPYVSDKLSELSEYCGFGSNAESFISEVENLISRIGINKKLIPYNSDDCFEIARKAQEEAKLVGYPRFFTDIEVRKLVDAIFSA